METDAEYWSRRAAAWESLAADNDSFYSRRSLIVARMIESHCAGHTLLDVGCGPGTLCRILAERGFEVVGTDIALAMVEAARLACFHVVPSVEERFVVCGPDDPRVEGPFDTVCAIGMLVYVRDPIDYLARLARRVRSGGLLVVSHTRPRSLRASLETVRHLGAFRPSAEWREVVANLFVTGAWKGNRHHPISSAAVDRWAVSAHYQKIASLDLYNLRIFGRDLDADPLGRGLIAAALARRLAWTHIGFYRHLPRKGGHG